MENIGNLIQCHIAVFSQNRIAELCCAVNSLALKSRSNFRVQTLVDFILILFDQLHSPCHDTPLYSVNSIKRMMGWCLRGRSSGLGSFFRPWNRRWLSLSSIPRSRSDGGLVDNSLLDDGRQIVDLIHFGQSDSSSKTEYLVPPSLPLSPIMDPNVIAARTRWTKEKPRPDRNSPKRAIDTCPYGDYPMLNIR